MFLFSKKTFSLKNIFSMKIFHAPKILIVVAVFGGIFIALKYFGVDFSNITMESFKTKIDSLGVWGPIAYIAFYVVRPLVLFPAAVLSASAGVIWGVKGLIYLLIGAYISAFAEFLIARYVARESIERLLKGKASHFNKVIEKKGFIAVLLIRLIPNVPWDVQNLGLGLTKVKFRDYVLATVIGILPGSFVLVYFGSSFISVLTNPQHFWKIILAFGLFAALWLIQRKLRKTKSQKTSNMTDSS